MWSLTLGGYARFEAGLDAAIKPPLEVTLQPPTGTVSVELRGGFLAQRPSGPLILLGQTGASRLEAQRFGLSLGFKAWPLDGTTARGEPTASAELTGGKAVIDLSKGDGFISKITGGLKLDTNLDLKAHWSPESGLRLEGSGAMEFAIPTHVSLGPINLQTIYLRAGLADGTLPIELSGAFSAKLGPLDASVDRIGLVAKNELSRRRRQPRPRRPRVRLQAAEGRRPVARCGVVKGGGYLFIDPERGEYAGALELTFAGSSRSRRSASSTRRCPTAVGLLAAHHHDGRVRHGHPARLRLHAARRSAACSA